MATILKPHQFFSVQFDVIIRKMAQTAAIFDLSSTNFVLIAAKNATKNSTRVGLSG
jgi:hypothetical protein